MPAHAAATAGFSTQEGEIALETDCLLEGAGFELMVPQSIQLDDVNGGRHAGGKSDIFATRTAY